MNCVGSAPSPPGEAARIQPIQDVGGRMNSIASDRANEGVAAKRLCVLQTAPSHPLSAPDPHLTLKLLSSELKRSSVEDAEQHEEAQA